MTIISGTTIKNVANGLSNGDISVESPQARGETGTFIDTSVKTVEVVDGEFDALDVQPGPILITINTEGATAVFEAVVPDQTSVDLWDLREQTNSYEPPIVSKVFEYMQRAEAAAEAAEGGGGGGALVEDPPGSGLYSPSSAGVTEDPDNPGLYLI